MSAFRVQKNAASLKLDHTRTGRYSTYCLPRSKERGLIEAVGKPVVTAPLVILPRSKERGLIEAWGAKFRGPSNVRVLPRSKERGLIEARLHQSQAFEGLHSLPRSKERGLIEATL